MASHLHLLWKIVSRGRLVHSGHNFNEARVEGLKGLEEFVPDGYTSTREGTFSSSKTFARMVRAQASHFRAGQQAKGGHLSGEKSGLSYIRIPKCASTSAGSVILASKFPGLQTKELTGSQWNYLIDANLGTKLNHNHIYFTIVRNPFARLVSVYRDFFEKQQDHFIYSDYLFGIFRREMSFEEFVSMLEVIPDTLKDQHLKPQHLFVKFYKQRNVEVTILKLEEPGKIADFLSHHQLIMPSLNKSAHDYDFNEYYSPSLRKRVQKIYRKDFLHLLY